MTSVWALAALSLDWPSSQPALHLVSKFDTLSAIVVGTIAYRRCGNWLRVSGTDDSQDMNQKHLMFRKILHANDGSEPAFHALSMAIAIARQNNSELHMVCVEEINYMPEFIEEVRHEAGTAARRYHKTVQRASALADDNDLKLHTHMIAGHPVRDIVNLAAELKVGLLVIGARGHSAVYERLVGSRADRIMQIAQCPVLVVK